MNLSLPAPTSGTPGRERYSEWRELIDEIHESIQRMGYAFMPLVPVQPGDDRNDYQAGIRRGNRVLGSRILIADAVQKAGLKQDWDELVQYTHSGRGPGDRWQPGSPTMGGFDKKASEFQEKLNRIARQEMEAVLHDTGLPPQVRNDETPGCDLWLEFSQQGSCFLLIQNSGAEPAFDVVVSIPADNSGFKSDVINRLDNDRKWIPCTSKGEHANLKSIRGVLAETFLRGSANGAEVKAIPVLIRYRSRKQQDCKFHLEVRMPLHNGIEFALPQAANERAKAKEELDGRLAKAQVEELDSLKKRYAAQELREADLEQKLHSAFAPEVVLEYECEISGLASTPPSEQKMKERRKPLTLRNLGGGTAYHVRVEDIASGQCTAEFEEISQIAEKSDATALPTVTDHTVTHGVDMENALRHDFVHLLERTYQTCGHDFDPIRVPIQVHYQDRNGKRYETVCEIEFDYFKTIARTRCEPPRPIDGH